MINPFKRSPLSTIGCGAVRIPRKVTVMTHAAPVSPADGIEPPNGPEGYTGVIRNADEAERLRDLLCDKEDVLINAHAEIDRLIEQLAEAKAEIASLQAIIDADQHTDAWLDVLVKRYPGSTPWQDPTAGLNAADNRRAQ